MANAILNVGQTGGQVNISTATAPATPAAGVVTLYAGTDKALHALNSDGTDITIAAAGAASPITEEQSNSLVSTAIGATAGAGANCAIVLGNNACAHGGAVNSVVIGPGSCHYAYGSDSVLIGKSVRSSNISTIGIGEGVISETQRGIAIGYTATTCCNNAGGAMAIGCGTVANGDSNCAGIAIGIGAKAFRDGIHLGIGGFSCASQSTVVGLSSQSFPGATGTMVLGNSSVGGTGACNSVVIGNSAQTTGARSIVIGAESFSDKLDAIVIGTNSCVVLSSGCPTGLGSIAIGDNVCTTANFYNTEQSSLGVGSNIIIGNSLNPDVAFGSLIRNSNSNKGGNVTLGLCGCISDNYNGVVIGFGSKLTGSNFGVVIGFQSCASGGDTDGGQTIIGSQSRATALCSQVFGRLSCSTHVGAVVIGPNINSERADTVHLNSLIAYGQAASKTNAVGSTGGSVTLNWDNSNIQTLTLTDNITTLTKSNPIDGAVYTLFLTQGGTGGKTVSWGTDVEWPGGTPPTLSTAAGSVDAVSLIYIAGVTGYYGNSNLNFS